MVATPGKMPNHQAREMKLLASARLNHDVAGSNSIPRPKNDRLTSPHRTYHTFTVAS